MEPEISFDHLDKLRYHMAKAAAVANLGNFFFNLALFFQRLSYDENRVQGRIDMKYAPSNHTYMVSLLDTAIEYAKLVNLYSRAK